MIYKSATSGISMKEITAAVANGMIRTAAAKLSLRKDTDASTGSLIEAEISKHPSALFFRAKAIAADEVNSNGDYFPREELLKSYSTFVGVPFYTNHNNQDVENARGKIIHAEWDDKDNSAYVVGFVDREAYPHICRGIEEDYMTGVSMGCSVEYSTCSICGNKAANVDEYCNHIKFKKGRKFTGTAKDVITGETKKFDNALVFEKNYGIRFIELSGVGDPACRSCRIEGVFDNKEAMKKAAKIENDLMMYKESSMARHAGAQEVQQLEEALKTIKDVSIKMIQESPKVELNFPSDLVKILAELQEFTDELVGAGYGQLDSGAAPGGIPGVDQSLAGAAQQAMPPEGQFGQAPQAIASPLEAAPGSVTGAPGAPPVKMPIMPTPPAKGIGAADAGMTLNKISDALGRLVKGLRKAKNENGDDDMRRTPQFVSEQKKEVMGSLNESWTKGKSLSPENTVSSATKIAKENGGLDMNRAAGRAEAPDQITERQLEQDKGMHARDGDERNTITQDQLNKVRKDSEPEQVTEVQIKDRRTDATPDTITQDQLKNQPSSSLSRKDEDRQTITQNQINDQRKGKEAIQTTEKQLDGGDVWQRSAFSRTQLKTASDHVQPVLDVLATGAIFFGATPEQMQKVASGLVSSVKSQNDLLEMITRETAPVMIDSLEVSARAKYWGSKPGMRFASVEKKDVENGLVTWLHGLVASDKGINPETIVDVMEVIGEDEDGSRRIAETIDEKLQAAVEEKPAQSKKAEILAALKQSKVGPQPAPANEQAARSVREAERKAMRKVLAGKATHKVEVTFDEIGTSKEEVMAARTNVGARKAIEDKLAAFMTNQSAVLGKKFAGKEGITNVSVKEDTIEIAIKWGGDDGLAGDVDLTVPGADGDIEPDLTAPEGDVAGDNLDALMNPPPPPAAAPAAGAPAPTPAPAPAGGVAAAAKSKGKMTHEAQMPGGAGIPGAPLGGGSNPADAMMAGAPSADAAGVQTFSEEPADKEEDKLPGAGEQLLPGSICPFCRSTDTNVGQEGREAGVFACDNCGAIYKFAVNVEVLNPDKMSFDKDGKGATAGEKVEEPKMPEMPVAADIDLSKGNLVRLAKCEKQHGHVCPACGAEDCKSQEEDGKYASYTCPACNTKVAKEVFIDKDDPEQSFMRVAWTVNPKKVFTNKGCKGCEEATRMFLARKKVAMMLKSAAKQDDPTAAFPMANCMEKIAKRYGSNAQATFGPCKGKPLADCVCKQLQQFNMRKTRFLDKFAELYTSKDPMDQCVEDHAAKGYKTAQAKTLCEAIRHENLGEEDVNMFIAALGGDKEFSKHELRAMHEAYVGMTKTAQEIDDLPPVDDSEIGAPEAPVPPEEPVGAQPEMAGDAIPASDTVTVEIPADVAQDIADQLDTQTGAKEEEAIEVPDIPVDGNVPPEIPDVGSAGELEVAAKSKGDNMKKEAEKAKHVENIESEVTSGIPRGKATMGNEGKDNIDKPMAKPSIPRSTATLGKEGPDNINVATKDADVPTGNAYMGHEKEVQSKLPGNTLKEKGTIIATKDEAMKKEAKTPDHVEHIETEVEAGIPRSKATIGNESASNIDVPMADPKIPTGKATLGKEGPDNIDVKMDKVDVPTGNAYMGNEKEVQKGMPGLEVKEKGTIIAEQKGEQMEKIAQARWKKACAVVARYVAAGYIREDEQESIIEDLSKLSFERIESFAEKMFKRPATTRTAAAQGEVLTAAVVQESTALQAPQESVSKSLADQLKDTFTVGSYGLTKAISEEK
jgi:hypothetical protein